MNAFEAMALQSLVQARQYNLLKVARALRL